ncbi:hypothetical protein FA95DRAFT_1606908 [Auriscalpium vulgare]|uniref:Uncharacterized protein n=1 Tax=Auriscalpium vulgare TaxID=40419 RepID=A0ACB8RQM5_9AGAM|nr:hypothetical protein FA95DRAFT_1606908 [Auriscalpium vulgare]
MGVFYALAKENTAGSLNSRGPNRYLVAFASRSVADEWWRAVQSNPLQSWPI